MNKLKEVFTQAKRFITPVKRGQGNLFVYQNIIVYSIWIFSFCFIASIVMELNGFRSGLFKEYLVGISCSLIVVLFTTIIQYSKEHYKSWKEYDGAVFRLLVQMSVLTAPEEVKRIDSNYKTFVSLLNDYFDLGFSIYWFNVEKELVYLRLTNEMSKLFLIVENREIGIVEK